MNRPVSGSTICFLFIAIFISAFSSFGIAEASEINVQNGTVLNFTVMRKGDEIGTHVIKFSRSGDRVGVAIKTDIEVKVLFVPVYHFNHQSREVWRAGKLAKLISNTDDDGKKHVLTIEGKATALHINGDGNVSTANLESIPASLWHPALTRPGPAKIINTLDGHLMAVNSVFKGEEKVAVKSGTLLAKHFVMTGELNRELWYGPDGMLVKARFKGSDGSVIEYVLK